MGASPEARRGAWWSSGGAARDVDGQRVPAFGEVVRDTALVERPGRVLDWDGGQLLTLAPPAGGESWTARLADVHPDRPAPVGAASGAAPVALLEQLDGAPLGLAVLAEVLRATRDVAAEEIGRGGASGHTILTATDTVRDRQRFGHALVGLTPVDDTVRIQVARAACTVVYGRMPAEPMTALLRWQRTVLHDRGALARVLGTAAERVETQASITRAEVLVRTLGTRRDDVDERP
jgi:hypothetical protein